jgi:hypothetical protein
MLDANPIAILLAALAASILLAYLLRVSGRLTQARRLKRSLRLAVGQGLARGPGQG